MDSPVTLLPRRVGLGVVRRQDHSRRTTGITTAHGWGERQRDRETERRETERQRDRETERQRQRDGQNRLSERGRERQRERYVKSERERE